MYFNSRDDLAYDDEGGVIFDNYYHIGYSIVFMALAGPYVIQYSTMINAIYQKGYF